MKKLLQLLTFSRLIWIFLIDKFSSSYNVHKCGKCFFVASVLDGSGPVEGVFIFETDLKTSTLYEPTSRGVSKKEFLPVGSLSNDECIVFLDQGKNIHSISKITGFYTCATMSEVVKSVYPNASPHIFFAGYVLQYKGDILLITNNAHGYMRLGSTDGIIWKHMGESDEG